MEFRRLTVEQLEEKRKTLADYSPSFKRMLDNLRGVNPKVKTVAIMTAQNPGGQTLNDVENAELLNSLSDELSVMSGVKAVKIQGHYGYEEESLVIFNISHKETLRLSKKYKQESYIFGESNGSAITYHLRPTEEPTASWGSGTEVFGEYDPQGEEVVEWNEYYSKYEGVKFKIKLLSI